MSNSVLITADEEKAIRSLRRLAKKWPQSIRLFSWSGTLWITKINSNGIEALVTEVKNIPNDGGDPNMESDEILANQYLPMDCDAAIIWPSKHSPACTAEVQP